jgi:hypothetical protein
MYLHFGEAPELRKRSLFAQKNRDAATSSIAGKNAACRFLRESDSLPGRSPVSDLNRLAKSAPESPS